MSKISQLLINKIQFKIFNRGRQTAMSLMLLVSIGITLAIIPAIVFPAHSEDTSSPVKLTQQGKDYYSAGKLDQAIETWQQAAAAYTAAGNDQGSRDSYLNTAAAQQALGLYDRSCDSLLSAFKITGNSCNQIIEDVQIIEPQLDGIKSLTPVAKSKLLPAIAAINQQPEEQDKVQGLLRFGDYLRASGYPRVANQALELGLASSEKLADPQPKTAALLSLGNAQRAIALQKQNQFSTQTIVLDVVANNSGSVTSALESYQPALDYYQKASEVTPRQADGLKAELNRLSLLLDIQEFWQRAITDFDRHLDSLEINDPDFLQEITTGSKTLKQDLEKRLESEIGKAIAKVEPEVTQLPATRTGIYSRINLAQSLMRRGASDLQTAQILATAVKQARSINNVTAEAEATGYLGSLYEQQGQYKSARRLTEGALQLAPTAEYPDIAYRWNAQLGKILAAQGQRVPALSAYETSFNTIRTLRSDLATTPVEPIFREYISLLLQAEPDSSQLAQARDVLESLQVATLDNFFRDPCSEIAEKQ
jgi:tetratricopeptide (TPR) repeat protein